MEQIEIKNKNGTTDILTLDETGAFVSTAGKQIFLSVETIKAIVTLSKRSKKRSKKKSKKKVR